MDSLPLLNATNEARIQIRASQALYILAHNFTESQCNVAYLKRRLKHLTSRKEKQISRPLEITRY